MIKRILVLGITALCLLLSAPVMATEVNIGGGSPLWDTHTDDGSTSINGGYLFYGSIDTVKKGSKWLSYGLMYNYARMELEVETTTTQELGDVYREWPSRDDTICLACEPWPTQETTTTRTDKSWLNVHVLGPYAKPFYKVSDHVTVFGMIGAGAMYVDGAIYGDEFGGAGFVSAGLNIDITKNLGLGVQMLYVKGATGNVDDIDYLAPVGSLSYSW